LGAVLLISRFHPFPFSFSHSVSPAPTDVTVIRLHAFPCDPNGVCVTQAADLRDVITLNTRRVHQQLHSINASFTAEESKPPGGWCFNFELLI